jgi:hypothetical protein
VIRIEYPKYDFRFKKEENKEFIFDDIRRIWLRLTPEEWVRQNFLQYLIQTMKYPASLIAVEKEIKLGELRKRCDIVVYKDSKPWMIVECKEMHIPISNAVASQIFNYNQTLAVDYLIITNGNNTFGLSTLSGQQIIILPDFL